MKKHKKKKKNITLESLSESIVDMSKKLDKSINRADERIKLEDKRFEQADKRIKLEDKRFEQADKRFDKMMKDMDDRFSELYSFLQKHMVTKEEFRNAFDRLEIRISRLEVKVDKIENNYVTKEDLQCLKSELMNVMDKVISDYKNDKQEHVAIDYHIQRITDLELRVDQLEGSVLKAES